MIFRDYYRLAKSEGLDSEQIAKLGELSLSIKANIQLDDQQV